MHRLCDVSPVAGQILTPIPSDGRVLNSQSRGPKPEASAYTAKVVVAEGSGSARCGINLAAPCRSKGTKALSPGRQGLLTTAFSR